jgi:glycosyltransferase involved in cell wall biosynthesis
MVIKTLNLFYEEPDPDRWIKFDRYPRRWIRRLVRGKQNPGGVMMVALELMRGLDKLKVPYRFNDFKYIKKHPRELACIIGKPQLLFNRQWKNPVLFGAGIYSHPVDCPDLFEKYPNVQRFLVPGEWMREMCEPYYGDKVTAWPVGIDTEKWLPLPGEKTIDFLIYNKVRWQYHLFEQLLIEPILKTLAANGLSYHFIRYGKYTHDELKQKLALSKAVIFLCEHETQGLAYQQILATDTPILAWDRGGYWQDPDYFPHKVRYQPVSSVPYWNELCGEKFKGIDDFEQQCHQFVKNLALNKYSPRTYILDNLTLEKSALAYLNIIRSINENSANT